MKLHKHKYCEVLFSKAFAFLGRYYFLQREIIIIKIAYELCSFIIRMCIV